MVKQRKAWQIMARQKGFNEEWYIEKFLAGGRIHYSFQEAQDIKNALKKMVSSTEFKVVRIQ